MNSRSRERGRLALAPCTSRIGVAAAAARVARMLVTRHFLRKKSSGCGFRDN